MPAVSQAQRGFLAHKFGPAWMKRHHFANKGKLPEYKHKTKKMNDPSKLVRLAQIDNQLDSIVRFAYDDEENLRRQSIFGSPTQAAARAGVLAGAGAVGAGGVLAHQAIQRAGGYRAVAQVPGKYIGGLGQTFKQGAQQSGMAGGKVARNIWSGTKAVGSEVGQGIAQTAGSAWQGILKKLGVSAAKALESKEKSIEFDEKILEPFGAQERSKIAQEQFPAGKSPGYQRDPTAEILKLPFPELMKLLKQRNILQEQFPGFSKIGRLIELNSELSDVINFKAIEPLNPKNKGKFTKTKEETGESTAELKHSKNPLTRKRAVFAENARKWHHK